MALVLKNIGIAKEATFAATTAPTYYPRIKSAGVTADENKKIVDDTPGTRKGFNRIVNVNKEVVGDVSGYVYSDDIPQMFFGALGAVISTAIASGYNHTISQIASGELPSFSISLDKDVEVIRLTGARVNTLQLSAANDIVEFVANILGSDELYGQAAYNVSTDQDLDPFVFSNVEIKLGDSLALASGATATAMDSWSFLYDNMGEQRWQSGSAGASRVDGKIAQLTGTFTKFYENTDFNTWKAAGTVKSLVIEITGSLLATSGTPHKHRITVNIPRIEMMTSVRPYEAGNLIVETTDWHAMYDDVLGYMVEVRAHNTKADYDS